MENNSLCFLKWHDLQNKLHLPLSWHYGATLEGISVCDIICAPQSPSVEVNASNRTCGALRTMSRWPALHLFEVAAVRKPFSLVMSPHHFPNNRGNKHSLEMAGQMCWSFHKERQLLGRQLSSLWGKKSMKPRIKSDRRYGDETKAVATVTKTWRMQ